MDGWTASSSCSPGFVGLQFHKEVLITKQFVCLSYGLKCTDMRRLQYCDNQASSFEADDEENADVDIEELTN